MTDSTNNPQTSIAQRARSLLDEIGDAAFVTNVAVEKAGVLAIDTIPSPTLRHALLLTESETYQVEDATCSCGEGALPAAAPTNVPTSTFEERSCPHLRSLLNVRAFDGLCECGHAEFHTVDVYAHGEPAVPEHRCTHCNRIRDDHGTDPERTVVHAGDRIVAGPMSEADAAEYVVERSALELADANELNPICSTCGTIQEVAVISSNVTGHLCPVCDDPTVEIVA